MNVAATTDLSGNGELSEPLLDTTSGDEDTAIISGDLTSPLLHQEDQDETSTRSIITQQQHHDETIIRSHYHVDDASSVEFPSYTVITITNPKEYFEILLMSIFTMTFMMLVLGSYFFEWSDTVLNVQVDTLVATNDSDSNEGRSIERGQTLSANLPLYANATFQSTLGIFQSSHSDMIVFLIITSAIIAPIVYTILQPIFILIITSYKAPSEIEIAQTLSYKFRSVVNFIFSQKRIGQILTMLRFVMKFSMSMIFVNSILNICTSNVEFILGGDFGPTNSTNSATATTTATTTASSLNSYLDQAFSDENHISDGNTINAYVVSNARGGIISYILGFSIFGIGGLILIQSYLESKLHHLKADQDEVRSDVDVDDDDVASGLNSHDGGTSILSPPPSAFKHHEEYYLDSDQYVLSKDESLLCDSSTAANRGFVDDAGLGSSTPITSNVVNTNLQFQDEQSEHMAPLLPAENDEVEQDINFTINGKDQTNRPSITEIILFECGLLSFILLIPIAILPLIKIEYSGLLRPLLARNTLENTSFTLLEVANAIVSSNNFGRDLFDLITILSFWINVIVVPLLTWGCCALLWFSVFFLKRGNSSFTSRILQIVKILHPFSFMTPFALSAFVTVSSLQQTSDFLFNQNGFCTIVQGLLSLDESVTKCMVIQGHILSGSYILLLHGIFLDVFVGIAINIL